MPQFGSIRVSNKLLDRKLEHSKKISKFLIREILLFINELKDSLDLCMEW